MFHDLTRVIGGKRYSTETATRIAHDAYWDGQTMERSGRNTYLYRTKKGNYFLVKLSQWQGEHDEIIPLSKEKAQESWEDLREREVDYEEAFDTTVEDA